MNAELVVVWDEKGNYLTPDLCLEKKTLVPSAVPENTIRALQSNDFDGSQMLDALWYLFMTHEFPFFEFWFGGFDE